MARALFLALSLLLFTEVQRQVEGSSTHQREGVMRYLMTRGSRLVRPDGEGGAGSPVEVKVNYELKRILGMDEDRGLLRTAGFLSMQWTDHRLSYKHLTVRGRAHNVTNVRLDASQIWTPDIELYNTDSPGLKSVSGNYLALGYPSGNLVWVPQVTFNSYCDQIPDPNVLGFNCTLRFGSWTYSSLDLDLQVKENPELSWTFPNRHWRIASSSVKLVDKKYECCSEHYLSADYNVVLFRQ